jgi:hypothetical protein
MQMVGADAATDIANRVKQVTGGDYSLTQANAVNVAKAFGFDRMLGKQVRESAESDQFGLAGNWQGKLLQLIHAGTIGGGIAHLATAGSTSGGGLGAAGIILTVIGGILLLFTETFWSKNRGQVGAMGRYGNQGVETGKGPETKLGEGQSEETSPVARAVLHRIMMAHPGMLAQHGPERVMSAVDELADRVNIGPDDEIGTSDVSGWVRDVIRMLSELPDEPMSDVDALDEAEKKGLYYNVNKRKQAGTSRDKNHPKAPTAQAWKDAAKTAKTEGYEIDEAEYQGRKVELNKPSANTDGASKSKVYVKDPQTGNVKKVTFGDPNMRIRKSNPGARKNFRARHNCANPGPKTKARYWSCRAW